MDDFYVVAGTWLANRMITVDHPQSFFRVRLDRYLAGQGLIAVAGFCRDHHDPLTVRDLQIGGGHRSKRHHSGPP